MKKLLLGAILAFSVISCSKSDTQENTPTQSVVNQASFIGKWRVEEIYINNTLQVLPNNGDCDKSSTLQMNSDLSYSYRHFNPTANNTCTENATISQQVNRNYSYNSNNSILIFNYNNGTSIQGSVTNKNDSSFELVLDFENPSNTTKRVKYIKVN